MYHGCRSDKAYERAHDEAEREWDEGLKQGLFTDDYDAREEFVAARLVANIPLLREHVEGAEHYRTMMQLLERCSCPRFRANGRLDPGCPRFCCPTISA